MSIVMPTVPFTFEYDTIIVETEVNTNFTTIYDVVDSCVDILNASAGSVTDLTARLAVSLELTGVLKHVADTTESTSSTTGAIKTAGGAGIAKNLYVGGKFNNITVTVPASAAILTIASGGALVTSGAYSLTLTATGVTNVTLPTTGTLATLAGAETLTNKTLTSPTINSPTLVTPALGTPASGNLTNCTGSPTLTSPALGTPASGNLANCTFPTLNQNTTGSAGSVTGLSVTAGKILSVSNSVTLAGTDNTTMTFPNTSGTVVTAAATQTLTNKTLTSPVISTITNTGTITLPTATDTLVGRTTTDTLTNKTLTSPVISTITNTGTITLPTTTDTLVGRATTDTLTNKTLTSPTINTPTINTIASVGGAWTAVATWTPPAFTLGGNVTLNGKTLSGAAVFDNTVKTASTVGVGNATPAASGAGITFPASQSASTDANTLDDYEEGTWTPGIRFGVNNDGITYASHTGWYTKVGNVVTVFGQITLSNKGSTTGNAGIDGLPFSPRTNTISIPIGPTINTLTATGRVECFFNTGGGAYLFLMDEANNQLTNGAFANDSVINFSATYTV